MAELDARSQRTLLLASVLGVAGAIALGIQQGGDFTQELRQSERLLRGLPLYPANPPKGIWWPPFTALGLIPFALLARSSLAVAQACWATLNVACLAWSVERAGAWTTGWTPVVLALAAIVTPVLSNFAYLNLTPIILALIVAAIRDLERGHDARAGAWLGLASALKVFPALLLLYLAYRRRWRGAGTGIVVAGVLTVGAMLSYGPVGAVDAVRDWVHLSREAPFARLGGQSLAGLAGLFGWPAVPWLAGAACVGGVWIALRPTAHDGGGGSERDLAYEIGLVTLLAVLLSPIAWPYYYVLTFPAWVWLLSHRTPPTVPGARPRRAALILAGILTAGALTWGVLPSVLWPLRDANYTWGGLLLLTLLIAERAWRLPSDRVREALSPERGGS